MNQMIKSEFNKLREYVGKKRMFKAAPKEVEDSIDIIEKHVESLESVIKKETAETLKDIAASIEYDAKNGIPMSVKTASEISLILNNIRNSTEAYETEGDK